VGHGPPDIKLGGWDSSQGTGGDGNIVPVVKTNAEGPCLRLRFKCKRGEKKGRKSKNLHTQGGTGLCREQWSWRMGTAGNGEKKDLGEGYERGER